MEQVIALLQQISLNTLLAAKDVLTIDEASIYTGISKSHLYKLTSSRQIPHSKPQGKTVYFEKSELNDWLTANRVQTQAEAEQAAAAILLKHGRK